MTIDDFLAHPAAATAHAMLVVIGVALLLAFYRLAKGPSVPDRVVALDVIATLLVGMIGVYSVAESEPVLLRVAMMLALVGFVGTVAFSFYLRRKVT